MPSLVEPSPPVPNASPQISSTPHRKAAKPAGQAILQQPRVRLVLGLVGLAALLLSGGAYAHWSLFGRFQQATNDAYLQADQVTVAPKISGYVAKVLVADNEEVAAGQPLVEIDPVDVQDRLLQTNAQAAKAGAAIEQIKAQVAVQQAQLIQARAQSDAATAADRFALAEVQRYTPLAKSGADSRERIEQLAADAARARAQLQSADAGLMAAQRQLAALRASLKAAEADQKAANAAAHQAGHDADSAVIRAAIDGRVGDRSVRQGQFVAPGVKLLSIVPVQRVYLVANFKETQIGKMRVGQPVRVKLDALPDRAIEGVVDSFAPGTGAQFALIPPSNATGNFTKIVQRVPVRIRLTPPADLKGLLTPGLSAEVEVDTRPRGKAQ
jgi:membrane fusion protein (multidrug efflux system)